MKSLDIVNSKVKKYTFFYTGTKYFIEDLNEEELEQLKQDLEILQFYKDYFTPEYIYVDEEQNYADCEFSGTDHEEYTYDPKEVKRFKQFNQWLEEKNNGE